MFHCRQALPGSLSHPGSQSRQDFHKVKRKIRLLFRHEIEVQT